MTKYVILYKKKTKRMLLSPFFLLYVKLVLRVTKIYRNLAYRLLDCICSYSSKNIFL